jgi:hypothetical protein
VAPQHDVLLKHLEQLEGDCTILYFTKQNHPLLYMNNISIYFNQKCKNIHIPGYEYNEIDIDGREK